MKKPFVTAIAAVSGGGKTTVSRALAAMLPCASVLAFDDYPGNLLGMDYCEWSENGANYNLWHLEAIEADIQKRLAQDSKHLILDYPFGYGHEKIGAAIDFAVFIDTPLDIALARRILRDYCRRDPARKPIQNPMVHMEQHLAFYLSRHRDTYVTHAETVRPFCDLVLDGTLPAYTLAGQIYDAILARQA